jgi:opacity protein-like surface antigen
VHAFVAALLLAISSTAEAQDGWMLRGFGDVGATMFTADESFAAVLGSSTAAVFGGGGEVILPRQIFVNVSASRSRQTGQRVFVSGGERFDLGIPTTVTLTPLQVTAGYRFPRVIGLTPFAGAGPGWYHFTETSQFADSTENVDERFSGFHILGGAEVRLIRWLSLGGELQWATVPDAIGEDPNSVAREFNESNLGSTTFRFRVIVGM